MPDDRLEFPNERRDLSPELARIAVFTIAIGPGPEADCRPEADKTVGGCEGGACLSADNGQWLIEQNRRADHSRIIALLSRRSKAEQMSVTHPLASSCAKRWKAISGTMKGANAPLKRIEPDALFSRAGLEE
jgi:hypothetical protein